MEIAQTATLRSARCHLGSNLDFLFGIAGKISPIMNEIRLHIDADNLPEDLRQGFRHM